MIASTVVAVAGLVSITLLVTASITDTVPLARLTTYSRGPLAVCAKAIPRGLVPTLIASTVVGVAVLVSTSFGARGLLTSITDTVPDP